VKSATAEALLRGRARPTVYPFDRAQAQFLPQLHFPPLSHAQFMLPQALHFMRTPFEATPGPHGIHATGVPSVEGSAPLELQAQVLELTLETASYGVLEEGTLEPVEAAAPDVRA